MTTKVKIGRGKWVRVQCNFLRVTPRNLEIWAVYTPRGRFLGTFQSTDSNWDARLSQLVKENF